jgi:hypothetical protein
MNELILDIKILIASYDDTVWARLYARDNEFNSYAKTDTGINMFISLFWKESVSVSGAIERQIFGKLHSFYDIPAYVLIFDYKCSDESIITYDYREWYKNGKLHRDEDKPAYIHTSTPYNHYRDTKRWYQNGALHREYGRPALISCGGIEKYYMNGAPHTEGYNTKRKSSRNKQSTNKRHKLR